MAERKERNDSVSMWTIVLGKTVKSKLAFTSLLLGTFKASGSKLRCDKPPMLLDHKIDSKNSTKVYMYPMIIKHLICGKMIFGRITIKNDASAQTQRLM